MSAPAVSVIVPVYNAGEGISRCVELLRGQTLEDIEMIFIDDCGQDASMRVVEAAASEDERIKIIYNEVNSGAGFSRNAGIEAATAEYVGFIDPDDYIDDDFFALLYDQAQISHADIVKGSRDKVLENDDGSTVVLNDSELNKRIRNGMEKGYPLFLVFTFEHTTAIYRRQLLMTSGARYGSSKNGQDTTFLLRACTYADSISFEERAVYHYVQREGSAVHRLDGRRLENEVVALTEKFDHLVSVLDDGRDEYAYRYASNLLKRTIGTYSVVACRPDSSAIAEKCLETMREQAMRMRNRELLCSYGLNVRALVEHGQGLAYDVVTAGMLELDEDACIRNAREWVGFLNSSLDVKDQYIEGYGVFLSRVLTRINNETLLSEDCARYDELIHQLFEENKRLSVASFPKDKVIFRAFSEHGKNFFFMRDRNNVHESLEKSLLLLERWVDFLNDSPKPMKPYIHRCAEFTRETLRQQWRAVDEYEDMDEADGVLKRMQDTLLRLDCVEDFKGYSGDIRIFVDQGKNYSVAQSEGKLERVHCCKDSVSRWVGYLRRKPTDFGVYGKTLRFRSRVMVDSYEQLIESRRSRDRLPK